VSYLIYPSLQQPVPITGNETFNVARWYKAWTEPNLWSRVSSGYAVATASSGYFYVPYVYVAPPDTSETAAYWQRFSEPDRQLPGLHASLQQAFTIDPYAFTQPEVVTESRWHQPWSEPVRHLPLLLPNSQPFFAYQPYPPEFLDIPWFMPLSEPKMFKLALHVSDHQFFVTGAHAVGNPYARGYVIC